MILLLACTGTSTDSGIDSTPQTELTGTWVRLVTDDETVEWMDADGADGPMSVADGRITTVILDIRESLFGNFLGLELTSADSGDVCSPEGGCQFVLAETEISGTGGLLVDESTSVLGGELTLHEADAETGTLSLTIDVELEVGQLTGEVVDAVITE